MIRIVIINGAPRSGKDTFVRYVRDCCNTYECAHVVNYSTVDTLKHMLTQLGWDGEKTDVARCVLANLKQFWINDCNNGPIREIVDRIFDIIHTYDGEDVIFFIHCREPHEIDKIKSVLNALSIAYPISVSTLIVCRLEAEKKALTNEADKNVDDYQYDDRCLNYGTLNDLREIAFKYVDRILGGSDE